MYTKSQVEEALRVYRKCGSATLTVRRLEYPSRARLYNWDENDEKAKNLRKENGALHCPSKPRFLVDEKINAVKRCFEGKESVELVAREIGCSNVTVYNWRNKYVREGVFSLMDENRKKRTQNVIDSNGVDQLRQQPHEFHMEVDILKETLNVIKKTPVSTGRT